MTNQRTNFAFIALLLSTFMSHGVAQNKGISSSLAYEFYYSGEMSDLFPFEKVKFKD